MLIKGGSNYSYEQINQELSEFLAAAYFGGDGGACAVAVVGLRLDSEHEDACCCTIELKTDLALKTVWDLRRVRAESSRRPREIDARPSSPGREPRPRHREMTKNCRGRTLVDFHTGAERPSSAADAVQGRAARSVRGAREGRPCAGELRGLGLFASVTNDARALVTETRRSEDPLRDPRSARCCARMRARERERERERGHPIRRARETARVEPTS